MNVLVTGGTGFIGEFFIPKLISCGHNVTLLVRNILKAEQLFGDKCKYIIGDITNPNSLNGCCEGIDIVYHMVAKVGNDLPNENILKEFRMINVEGTKNLINECKKSSIKRFIFVSSIAAMGIVHENPINEESTCSPYLPYQISKYEAERLILSEVKNNSFPAIIIRPTKVYGVGEHEYSYLTLAKLCKRGFFIKVGKGDNYTSNIYISDFVNGLINLLDKGRIGETYILTSSDSISFLDLGKLIATSLNKKIIIICIPEKLMILLAGIEERIMLLLHKKPFVTERNILSTIVDRRYDISKSNGELAYFPKITMEEGIKKTIEWYIKNDMI